MTRSICPHCGIDLANRFVLPRMRPGVRRFLPVRIVQVCPSCGGELYDNPYPAPRWLAPLQFAGVALMGLTSFLPHGSEWRRWFTVVAIGVLLAAAISTAVAQRWIPSDWPRYSATPRN